MKHVWVAIDQSPVECNGDAVILGIFRKRKRAMAACEKRYRTWPIGAKRRPRWNIHTPGDDRNEIHYLRQGTFHYPGLCIEKMEVR